MFGGSEARKLGSLEVRKFGGSEAPDSRSCNSGLKALFSAAAVTASQLHAMTATFMTDRGMSAMVVSICCTECHRLAFRPVRKTHNQ